MREKHKQLNKKGAITHIKKCFTYAVSQNKGNSINLAKELQKIPDHLYNHHENCGVWCSSEKKHTIAFSDPVLYEELTLFFSKYAANASKFSVAASSQGNESINNIVAHKAHKNVSLSTSAACDYRVADSVCAKNDGELSLINYQKAAGLSTGSHTINYVKRIDNKAKIRKTESRLKSKKLRRLQLKRKRESLRKSKEKIEGITYQSNCGFDADIIETCNESCSIDDEIIYFDLETTGLSNSADIVQIAAKSISNSFNVYINPTKKIFSAASKINGFTKTNGVLYLHNRPLGTLTTKEALCSFQQFLEMCSKSKKCLLVAHNATFDIRIFLRHVIANQMTQNFKIIAGFSDTLKMFRKNMVERKDKNNFKLESLAKEFLNINSENFHDATYDIIILEQLVKNFNYENKLFDFHKKYVDCYNEIVKANKINYNLQFLMELKNIVSSQMLKRLAINNITFESMRILYKDKGECEIEKLFKEKITKNKNILSKVILFLKTIS